MGCAITYLNPSTRFLCILVLSLESSALPLSLINSGDATLIRANKVLIQNESTRDSEACSFHAKEVTKNRKGVTIVPTCHVIVFIATA